MKSTTLLIASSDSHTHVKHVHNEADVVMHISHAVRGILDAYAPSQESR